MVSIASWNCKVTQVTSLRSRCYSCRDKFEKSAYAVHVEVSYSGGIDRREPGREKHLYHFGCCKKHQGITCSADLRGFHDLPKDKQSEITKLLFPNQVPKLKRAKLTISKCIDEMSYSELKLE